VEKRTGTLEIVGRESRLNGVVLAKCDSQDDPIQEATGFLKDIPLRSGDSIWVNGSDGHVGNTDVFCITEAGKSPALEMVAEMSVAAPAKKVAKARKKKTRKTGKKKPAKPKTKKNVKRTPKGRRKKP
jgi:hypothetical protein